MLTCSFRNLSPLPRAGWGLVTVPSAKAKTLPVEASFECHDGRVWRAVRGVTRGTKTAYRVDCALGGGERVVGRITPIVSPAVEAKRWHPWCYDDPFDLLPRIAVAPAGTAIEDITEWSEVVRIDELEGSPAHSRFRVHQRLPASGLHFTCWLDLLHRDPVVPFRARIVWSDRADPANLRRFEHLVWKCGEYAAFNHARRLGIQDQIQVGRKWVCLLNTTPVTFGDGVALPIRGRLLSFENNPSAHPPADTVESEALQRDFQSLKAAAFGEIRGICHEWDGDWLACGNAPRFHKSVNLQQIADQDWSDYQTQQQIPAGWFGDRMFGLARTPGQTGRQDDFGATKGSTAVVAHDERAIEIIQWGADGDPLRGYHHFESDGAPIAATRHPDWITWSRVTHWHHGVSIDRLGKNGLQPFPQGAFEGIDDEHMSHNYLAAAMALDDDPLLEESMHFLLTTDLRSYRTVYPHLGAGATRAQGRTAGAWAQLACVADQKAAAGFAELIALRFLQSVHLPTMRVAGPMKVPSFGHPDPRKPIWTTTNELGPWVCMWELGLFLVGCAQVVLRGEREGWPVENARTALALASETMAQFGFFEQGGIYYTVHDVLWSNGEPPPGGMHYPSRHLTAGVDIGDVRSWTFAGVLVARDFLGSGHPLADRMNRYVSAMTGGHEARDRDSAEWWAARSPNEQIRSHDQNNDRWHLS